MLHSSFLSDLEEADAPVRFGDLAQSESVDIEDDKVRPRCSRVEGVKIIAMLGWTGDELNMRKCAELLCSRTRRVTSEC